MIAVLFYVSLIEQQIQDESYNIKRYLIELYFIKILLLTLENRGLVACAIFFVLFGVTQTPDGPFIRPHPAFWRLVLCLSVLYEIVLIYILFQVSLSPYVIN